MLDAAGSWITLKWCFILFEVLRGERVEDENYLINQRHLITLVSVAEGQLDWRLINGAMTR